MYYFSECYYAGHNIIVYYSYLSSIILSRTRAVYKLCLSQGRMYGVLNN